MIFPPMLIMTNQGLYCRAGDFYIDPKGAVDHAVITHAHSDHARRGSRAYYCATSGTGLLKSRLGKKITVKDFDYGQTFTLNDVKLSFHPAGHILGSAQVRIEWRGEVWVISGDYKRDADPTCEPFETVTCDVFVTEATFGTPAYRWNKEANIGQEIFNWWQENAKCGMNSVLCAYSLGKTQRILGLLHSLTQQPIHCYATMKEINACYRAQGVKLVPTVYLKKTENAPALTGELMIVPPSFLSSNQVQRLGRFKTAFASGWMAKENIRFDRGFILSDHADWNDLLKTVLESQAKRVYVQHRGNGSLVKKLRSLGLKAYPDHHLFPKNPDQLTLF